MCFWIKIHHINTGLGTLDKSNLAFKLLTRLFILLILMHLSHFYSVLASFHFVFVKPLFFGIDCSAFIC